MEETQILVQLRSRVWRNLCQVWLANQSGEPRCWMCAKRATMREVTSPVHVCSETCQANLRDLNRFFALGVEGGMKRLREPDPAFQWAWIPPEIIAEMLLWAYRYALHSRAEYNELMELSRVSNAFAKAVRTTMRRITFLSHWITALGDEKAMSQFRALETTSTGGDQAFYHVKWLAHFRNLTSLALVGDALGFQQTATFALIRALPRLRVLRLDRVLIPGGALRDMTTLEHLRLSDCRFNRPIGLTTTLRSLALFAIDSPAFVASVDDLAGLTELRIASSPLAIPDLTRLVNLTALATTQPLRGGSFNNLRHLSTSHLTYDDLVALPSLTSLDTDSLELRDISTSTRLSALRLSRGRGNLPPMPGVTRLGVERCGQAFLSVQSLNGFRHLTSLYVDNTQLPDAALALLTSLRRFYYIDSEYSPVMFGAGADVPGNQGLAALTSLEVLFLRHASHVSYQGVSVLTALRELYLHRTRENDATFAREHGEKAAMLYEMPSLRYLCVSRALKADEAKAARLLDVTVLEADYQPEVDRWWPEGLQNPFFRDEPLEPYMFLRH